jgi:hypothetical protein
MVKDKTLIRNIAQNKKAYHEYYIEDTYQAGITAQRSNPCAPGGAILRTVMSK